MKDYKIFQYAYLFLSLCVIYACSDNSEDLNPEDPCINGGPQIEAENMISSVIGKSTGEITVSAENGMSPYMFSIDGINFQSSGVFSNLSTGDYTLTVKDGNDCLATITSTVPEVPEVFYSNQIRPIIDVDCQKSGCHGSNSSIPSYETYEDVKAFADLIKIRTSNKTMPPAGPLTPTKIQLIADWVDQGAPNN